MKKLIAMLVLGMFVGGVAFAADPAPKVLITITKIDDKTAKYVEVQTVPNGKITREMTVTKLQLNQLLETAKSQQTMVVTQNAQAKVDVDVRVTALTEAKDLLK